MSETNFAEQERARLEAELADLRSGATSCEPKWRATPTPSATAVTPPTHCSAPRTSAASTSRSAGWPGCWRAATPTSPGQLPNGTEVKLRFPGDEPVRMRVINYIEETPAGEEDTTLTADSPLGLALFGRKAGETVTYSTPRGELQVDLLAIELPTRCRRESVATRPAFDAEVRCARSG